MTSKTFEDIGEPILLSFYFYRVFNETKRKLVLIVTVPLSFHLRLSTIIHK